MEIDHLVKMANQIGDYFGGYPDRDENVKAIAQHVRNFWEPRMRREIVAHINQTGGGDLKEIVREALLTLEP